MNFVAEMHDGTAIRYTDRKRYLWILSALSPGVPAFFALVALATENPFWTLGAIGFYYAAIPVLDALFGEDRTNPPEEVVEQMAADNWYRSLLFAAALILWVNFLVVAYVVGSAEFPLWAKFVLAVSAGAASGSGLTISHELGHKQRPADRFAAKMVNALTGYAHFCIEHNRGHHLLVATPEDHASSRLGESVWAFSLREIPGVLRHGIALERARLEKKDLPFWHFRNDLLQGWAITAMTAIILISAFGWIMVPFLLINTVVGYYHLTFANYVEHYGLKRARKPNGRFEPCKPIHSWNTNHIVSNLLLFHLQRHSDHHANPQRPYQSLRNFETLPRLPSGYPGTFLLAAVPPLWRRVMDRKVIEWAKGDPDRCNIQPGLEDRYANAFQKSPD